MLFLYGQNMIAAEYDSDFLMGEHGLWQRIWGRRQLADKNLGDRHSAFQKHILDIYHVKDIMLC